MTVGNRGEPNALTVPESLSSGDQARLERMVLEARQRLASARSSGGCPAARVPSNSDGADDQGTGATVTDPDGRIAVTALHGRIQRVELDPRVLRLDMGALAARLERSLNAALADPGAALRAEVVQSPVDLRGVARELDQARTDAARQMREINGGIADAVAQLRRGAQVPGYLNVPDFDGLLADLAEVLSLVAAWQEQGNRAEEPGEAQGTGETADGLVGAVVVPGGRVLSLRIDARAVRAGSRDLAAGVTTAVNSALDDLARRRPPAGARPEAVDRAEISGRLQEIQDRGLDQLRALGASLSTLMNSIRPAER